MAVGMSGVDCCEMVVVAFMTFVVVVIVVGVRNSPVK
jgi:hypothetical protein